MRKDHYQEFQNPTPLAPAPPNAVPLLPSRISAVMEEERSQTNDSCWNLASANSPRTICSFPDHLGEKNTLQYFKHTFCIWKTTHSRELWNDTVEFKRIFSGHNDLWCCIRSLFKEMRWSQVALAGRGTAIQWCVQTSGLKQIKTQPSPQDVAKARITNGLKKGLDKFMETGNTGSY